jgi:hypothetical protein
VRRDDLGASRKSYWKVDRLNIGSDTRTDSPRFVQGLRSERAGAPVATSCWCDDGVIASSDHGPFAALVSIKFNTTVDEAKLELRYATMTNILICLADCYASAWHPHGPSRVTWDLDQNLRTPALVCCDWNPRDISTSSTPDSISQGSITYLAGTFGMAEEAVCRASQEICLRLS